MLGGIGAFGTWESAMGILRAQEHFRQYFVTQGAAFTKGYLSAFTGLRKFLAEWELSAESNKYHGAKLSLR